MKEFFVGLLVLVAILVFSMFGLLLYPFFIVLGFFVQCLIVVIVLLAAIWALGKVALLGMKQLRK